MVDTQGIEEALGNLQIEDQGKFYAESEIAGEHEALQALRELIVWPQLYGSEAKKLGVEWAKGLLLYGPPGCGKTKLVQAVCKEIGAKIHGLTSSDVFGAFVGESERRLRDVFESAREDALSGNVAVVFMDEVDSLCPKRNAQKPHETRVVSQLLTLIDGCTTVNDLEVQDAEEDQEAGGYVVVIGATNRPNVIDPAVRRPGRLDREIAISVPDTGQRLAILRLHTRTMPLSKDVKLEELAASCHGYTGADIEAVCREAAMHRIALCAGGSFSYSEGKLQEILQDDFEAALLAVPPSIARGYEQEVPTVCWNDIGGLDFVKEQLKRAVEWPLAHADAFVRLGLKPAKGIVLYGPPGCCKTTLAKAAATESGARLLSLSCSQVYSMYVGEGEAIVRETFRRARLSAPAIILLDEVDSIAGARDRRQGSGGSRLLSSLLTEMDGLELSMGLIVIAATNRPTCLDPAFIRPGRLDVRLYVPPPDLAGRQQTLEIHTRSTPLGEDVDLKAIAMNTELFTGADLASLCREAAICALRDDVEGSQVVKRMHFEMALSGLKPSISQLDLQVYEQFGRQSTQFSTEMLGE